MKISDSHAVQRLADCTTAGMPFRVAALDLDGTFCVTQPATHEELVAREAVNHLLDARYAARGYISYRTLGLMISSATCDASRSSGFRELPPKLGKDHDKAITFPMERLPEFNHVHNPHFAVGIGTGMCFREYPGNTFHMIDGFTAGVAGGVYWRSIVMWILEQIDEITEFSVTAHLADIEFESNYFNGRSNVYPLPYRIQLDFSGEVGLEMKLMTAQRIAEFREKVMKGEFTVDPIVVDVLEELVMLDESNPAKGRYTLYLLPNRFRKEYCVDFILNQLHLAVPGHFNRFKVLLADDTLTGLGEAVRCRNVVNGTFILPGGSRLEEYLLDPTKTDFAGEPLDWIKSRMVPVADKAGHYDITNEVGHTMRFIISAQAYPRTVGPASIQAFLEQEAW